MPITEMFHQKVIASALLQQYSVALAAVERERERESNLLHQFLHAGFAYAKFVSHNRVQLPPKALAGFYTTAVPYTIASAGFNNKHVAHTNYYAVPYAKFVAIYENSVGQYGTFVRQYETSKHLYRSAVVYSAIAGYCYETFAGQHIRRTQYAQFTIC